MGIKRATNLIVLSIFAIFLEACVANPFPQTGAQAKLLVREPWARPATIEGGNSAIYLTLVNESGVDDVLLSAASDAAEAVELHQSSVDENDIMQMSPVTSIPVPAGGTVALEPGGKHIMLIGLKQPLTSGDKLQMTLSFAQAGEMIVAASVRENGVMGNMGHDDEMEHGE